MKILTCVSPGHFEYGDLAKLVLTKEQALLKIHRIGICGTDLHAFEGTQPYFNYPRILGHEIGAEVIEYDGDSTFKQGEIVTILPYFNCGVCIACKNRKQNCCANIKVCGVHIDGGMSEYITVPSYSLVHGDGLSLDALSLVEPLAIGAHAIRRADVKPGEYVLVVGAGPIGLGTMEFARLAGAQIIALDINAARLTFCKEKLKVNYTINGIASNVAEHLKEITKGDMPTVVIDATGSLKAINNGFQFIAHGGRYILVGLQKETISFSHPEFHKREATLIGSRNATREDFDLVIKAIKNKAVDPTTYITHRVKFDQVKGEFESWLNPANGVIKAVVEF